MLKTSKILRVSGINLKLKNFNSTLDYKAVNEPIGDYLPNSAESKSLKQSINKHSEAIVDVPIVIGDEEIRTSHVCYQVAPFDHQRKLARYYYADKGIIDKAIRNNVDARMRWESTPFAERAKIILKAADLMASTYRNDLLATTILGQAKTVYQAEIDAVCELVDFLRFNVQFGFELNKYKPLDSGDHTKNQMQNRGIEGFVAAISPFNCSLIYLN